MFQIFKLLIFELFLHKTLGEYLCSANSNACPKHLPFCAAGRCVYQCASISFINGTDCVDNCGNWYINNSRCVEQCPQNVSFVHEVTLSALTTARYCYSKCPLFTYADNITCLERCPVVREFVENGTCVTSCSESLRYRYPVLERNKHIQVNGTKLCMDKCPDGDYYVPGTNELLIYGSRYVLNNTCVKSCGSLFESDGVCVEQCPNNTKTVVFLEITYNNLSRHQQVGSQFSSSPGKHAVCNGRCRSFRRIQNKECVDRCASVYKEVSVNISTNSFLSNARVCVSTCPVDQPYETAGLCVSKCEIFTNGTKCVSDCGTDRFVFNETCVDQCPQNRSFIAEVAKSYRRYYSNQYVQFQECVEACSNGSLIVGKKCLTKCPKGMSVFNHTCVFECPEPFQFTMLGSVSQCVETCTSNYYIYNNTCYKKCPKELKVLNNTCVEECPETYKYTMKKVVNGEPFSCVSECPADTFYKEDTCVDHCNLVYKNTCVDGCPPMATLMQVPEPNYQTSYRKINRCTRTCSENTFKNGTKCVLHCGNWFVYNNTCVEVCPSGTNLTLEMVNDYRYKLTFCLHVCTNITFKEGTRCVANCTKGMLVSDRSCVPVCPESQPYKHVVNKHTECLSTCPNNTFVDGHNCVPQCKAHMFVTPTQVCVEDCPNDTPYIYELELYYPKQPYNTCVASCPDGYLANGSICIKSYTCVKFQYDGKCIQNCPDGFMQIVNINLSLIIFLSDIPHLACVESCPDGKLANGSKCIDSIDCNGFQYKGKCLFTCPNGFIQVSDQQIDVLHNLQCVSLLSYKVGLAIACVALVAWGVTGCAFLSMREGFVNSLLWCRKEPECKIYTGNLITAFGPRASSDETDTRNLLDNTETSETEDTSVNDTQTSEETEIKRPIYDDCGQHEGSEVAQVQRNINL